jgi:hypothetical protein
MDDKLIKVTTDSGYECTVDLDAMDDWRLTKIIADGVDDAKGALRLYVFFEEHVLSRDDARRLKEHATRNGRVASSLMLAEIQKIFEAVRQTKNSRSSQGQ